MPKFDSDGVAIVYDDFGEGRAHVLLHGFASHRKHEWRGSGWDEALFDARRRFVAPDLRGHGESDKPDQPAAYATDRHADDVIRLLDHLKLDRVELMGFSMGARVAAHLLIHHQDRLRSVVLAGIGGRLFGPPRDSQKMVDAMLAPDPSAIADPLAAMFRAFADEAGADRAALAVATAAPRVPIAAEDFAKVQIPVLVLVGNRDQLAGDPQPLADAIPGAQMAVISGAAHHGTIASPRAKPAVFEFWGLAAPQAADRWKR
jgi:pimeloyl-ACP methyl ester carboxylesterase